MSKRTRPSAARHIASAYEAKYRAKYPERVAASVRAQQYKRKYGLTVAEYERMNAEQQGQCAVCHRSCSSGRRLAVDHSHTTLKVRGLLCTACNGKVAWYENRKSEVQGLLARGEEVTVFG